MVVPFGSSNASNLPTPGTESLFRSLLMPSPERNFATPAKSESAGTSNDSFFRRDLAASSSSTDRMPILLIRNARFFSRACRTRPMTCV